MKNNKIKNGISSVVSGLVEIHSKVKKMSKLPDIEKAKIENNLAIEQLYNSSRLEGTRLTEKKIERAIFGYDGA